MKWESIEHEDIKELIKQFYVFQFSLIATPLGRLDINNQPEFPIYQAKYAKEMNEVASILLRFNIVVKEAKLPEASTSSEPLGFLQDLERLQALRYCLVQDKQVIQPPKNLDSIVSYFVQKLPTPWH